MGLGEGTLSKVPSPKLVASRLAVFRGESALLFVILERVELVVAAALMQQLLVCSLLLYDAVREQNDIVSVLDRRQSMGDDQHCADVLHLFQRVLNEQLGLGVDIRRCLVEDHDLGAVEYRTCK